MTARKGIGVLCAMLAEIHEPGAELVQRREISAAGATRRRHMKRTLLLSVAALTLAGAASVAQAAPASPALGTIKVATSELAGKVENLRVAARYLVDG